MDRERFRRNYKQIHAAVSYGSLERAKLSSSGLRPDFTKKSTLGQGKKMEDDAIFVVDSNNVEKLMKNFNLPLTIVAKFII